MASIRQTHACVPSSESPPVPEWACHAWYVMRMGALQATDKLTDEAAASLVSWFRGFETALPCAECRLQYVQDWEAEPFTTAHAHNTMAAMKWVEDLRIKIEGKAKTKKAAAAAPTPPRVRLGSAAAKTPAPAAVATPRAVKPAAAAARPVVSGPLYAPKSVSGDAMQRQVAIKSALQQSAANRAGPRGCNCGGRR